MTTPFAYAGFWRRFIAYVIDGFIYGILLGLTLAVLGALGIGLGNMTGTTGGAVAVVGVLAYLILVAGYFVYFAWFESSSWQATPGKRLLSLKVVDLEGNQVSFLRALGRNLGKILSAMILYIGFIMAAFTKRKQALHDMLVECLVIRKVGD